MCAVRELPGSRHDILWSTLISPTVVCLTRGQLHYYYVDGELVVIIETADDRLVETLQQMKVAFSNNSSNRQ